MSPSASQTPLLSYLPPQCLPRGTIWPQREELQCPSPRVPRLCFPWTLFSEPHIGVRGLGEAGNLRDVHTPKNWGPWDISMICGLKTQE